ncbi:hypothetical protein [Actinotalea sp. K2]|uniref:hypothetical protein n=1 Tax=Actinotalea sp. K2 TaxID=2939438 RepID=UPI00201722ED|nr:hypothetical protein [Actinotalea sp. K2]MCL3862096.1 hypothetical protein [Actinotalea sp. K2]
MTEFVNLFAASYQVDDDPSRPVGERTFDFVTTGVAELAPAVEITITPATGDTWHGRFFGNYDGPNVVVNGPSPDVLVVVAAGVAYVVPVGSPPDYRALPAWPVRSVHCALPVGLVLLVDFTGVTALGEGGVVRWEAKDVVSDGFTDVLVTPSTVVVGGYVAPEARDVETTLDLATGAVVDRR